MTNMYIVHNTCRYIIIIIDLIRIYYNAYVHFLRTTVCDVYFDKTRTLYTIHPYCVNANLITDISFEGSLFYLVRFLLTAYVLWALLLKTLNRVKLSLHLH